MDPSLIQCNRCKHEYNLNYFVNKLNGQQTKNCSKCREQYRRTQKNAGTRYYHLREHYVDLVQNLPPCEICGDDNPDHKEFDHIDPQTKVSEVNRCKSKEAMDIEAKKCRSLCKKCHTKISYEQSQDRYTDDLLSTDPANVTRRLRRKRNHNYVNDLKLKLGGCQNEGCSDIFDPKNLSFYEFDHIDFKQKNNTVSYFVLNRYSLQKIQEEIDKCQLWCGYCHRAKTQDTHKDRVDYHKSLDTPLEKHEKKPPFLYSPETIQEIRDKWNTGNYQQKELARYYNMNISYVNAIINNRVHKCDKYIKTHSRTRSRTYPRMSYNSDETLRHVLTSRQYIERAKIDKPNN